MRVIAFQLLWWRKKPFERGISYMSDVEEKVDEMCIKGVIQTAKI